MLKKRLIPCLDIKNGRVVKGVNFINLVDAGDPVEIAKIYNSQGADELCFLDIAATKENRGTILELAKKTAEACFMPLTIGGGVRSIDDVNRLLAAGADKVSFNSAAVKNPDLISSCANKFGAQCIVVAIDAKKNKDGNWYIYTHGGSKGTNIEVKKFALEMQKKGAGEILLTSMDNDGTKKGYDIDLTEMISNLLNIPVIASGGVGKLEHLVKGIKKGKASAVLAASIFHFGQFTIKEAKQYMIKHGIPMRLT